MGKLLQELKRRKVFRVAAVYAVVAWLLMQVATTITPALALPEWTATLVIVLLGLGFIPALVLAWAYDIAPEGIRSDVATTTAVATTTTTDRKLIYATFFLVLVAVGFQLSERILGSSSSSLIGSAVSVPDNASPSLLRASIILDQPLPDSLPKTVLSISPDGSALAYANAQTGEYWLRDLATADTQLISRLPGIGIVEFSPDSRNLFLFQGNRTVSMMPLAGGGLRPLPISTVRPPAWLTGDTLLYVDPDGNTRIYSLTGAAEVTVSGFDSLSAVGPFLEVLPEGTAFLYDTAHTDGRGIGVHSLVDESSTLLINSGYSPRYASSGHLLFLRDADLWAVPFDAETLTVTGGEVSVLSGVWGIEDAAIGAYAISDSGRLIYLPDGSDGEMAETRSALVWADRSGNREAIPLPPGHYEEPRLSPNGELLALTSFTGQNTSNVWVYEFSTGSFSPLTFSGNTRSPVWTPDGSQIVYQDYIAGSVTLTPRGELWIKNADGTGQAERILADPAKPDAFSPVDGKLIYFTGGVTSSINLSTLTPSDGAWVPEPLFPTPHATWGARVSPDGRWIAYGSNETGTMQVYVQPYPNLDDGRWQISSGAIGSREPSWGPNGDELFFIRSDGSLMHAEISIQGNSISPGVARPLITGLETSGSSPLYVVSNDGERILHLDVLDNDQGATGTGESREFIVIENYHEELARLAPSFSNLIR